MPSFYDDNEDLRWYIDTGIDWEPIVRLTEYDWKAEDGFTSVEEAVDFYRDVLGLVGEFSATQIAPRWKELDAAHPHLEGGEVVEAPVVKEVFAGLEELGLHSLCLPRELGGMNAPVMLFQIQMELFARADVSICTHVGFHGGMALAALSYSLLEGTTTFSVDPPRIESTRFQDAIEELASGAAWGSMDITEPGAGSDMAALRCKGEQAEDGSWTVSGEKVFITSGHGKYHFVIARTEPETQGDPLAGLAGLSMFLVPAYETTEAGEKRWLAQLGGLEEKLGHNASATVSIVYDQTPAHLIGERGEGFRYMLMLMNNARVGVGYESLGAMEAAWRAAVAYAAERPSMGKPIDQHEMVADYLDEMETDIQGLRALAMYGGFHEELAQRYRLGRDLLAEPGSAEQRRFDGLFRRHQAKARRVTPLAKYLGAEKAVEIARRCVQIHGGVGYTKEYGAEKLLRDAMVLPVYEGTSQIQALMAMKDALGRILKNPQAFVARVAQARWRALSARDPLEKRVAKLTGVALAAQQFLMQRTATDKLRGVPVTSWPQTFRRAWDPKRDFAFAMLHAERLTRLMADVEIVRRLWAQARRHEERRDVLARYLERAEPRCRFLYDEITTTGARLLAKLAGDPDEARSAG